MARRAARSRDARHQPLEHVRPRRLAGRGSRQRERDGLVEVDPVVWIAGVVAHDAM